MSVASTTPTRHALIDVGQRYRALPRKLNSPEGIEWDYPYGEGIITVECVSEAGEPTEFGDRAWEAVWYRFEGSDEIKDHNLAHFLLSFSRI